MVDDPKLVETSFFSGKLSLKHFKYDLSRKCALGFEKNNGNKILFYIHLFFTRKGDPSTKNVHQTAFASCNNGLVGCF